MRPALCVVIHTRRCACTLLVSLQANNADPLSFSYVKVDTDDNLTCNDCVRIYNDLSTGEL